MRRALARAYADLNHRRAQDWKSRAIETQAAWRQRLLREAASTEFGVEHGFDGIRSASDFAERVPRRDYEALKPWVDRMVQGAPSVLWPGRPLYYAKTSGTTSGTKYIPISRESMPFHIRSAREALLAYIHHSGNARFTEGKMIFLQGSPEMYPTEGVLTGRLSGIVAHHIPAYLQKNRLPSWETNCIDDWETKVDAIVRETRSEDMRLISGIPPWVQMYFERLLEATGKSTVREVFPHFSLFVTGGVAYEPYRATMERLIGGTIDKVETYPASEGFMAYDDSSGAPGLQLLTDHGIYFEFVPADRVFEPDAPRLGLEEVELGRNYAVVMSTNAGLWAYEIGDTIEFVSLHPFRIKVSGRTKHFISAFGEHVIGSEVEAAIQEACTQSGARVLEFTVAPQVAPADGLPYHEWFIAFDQPPTDITLFHRVLDETLQAKNAYYLDLIQGGILRPAVVRSLGREVFNDYMRSQGKLGGQNKLPRLSNDRRIADALKY